jgi:hypothetical protein
MILADVVWPSLILIGRILTWWSIAIGLVIEYLFLIKFFTLGWKKSLIADVVMNAISSLAGLVLIPASGLIWELIIGSFVNKILHVGTFNPVAWGASVLLAIVVNTIVESLSLRYIFKHPIHRKEFGALFVANSFSVAAAFISIVISPPKS